MCYKNSCKIITPNVNYLQVDLIGFDLTVGKKILMIITGLMSETVHLDNYLLKDGDNVYQVEASVLNYPIEQTIRDSQISLDRSEVIMNTNSVKCTTRSCHAYCSIPETGLSEIRRNKDAIKRHYVATITSAHF